jgi:hypothetical protein
MLKDSQRTGSIEAYAFDTVWVNVILGQSSFNADTN